MTVPEAPKAIGEHKGKGGFCLLRVRSPPNSSWALCFDALFGHINLSTTQHINSRTKRPRDAFFGSRIFPAFKVDKEFLISCAWIITAPNAIATTKTCDLVPRKLDFFPFARCDSKTHWQFIDVVFEEKQVKHPSSEEQANTDTKENMKAGADVNVSAEETCVATETRDEPSDPTKEDKGVTKCKRDRKKEISSEWIWSRKAKVLQIYSEEMSVEVDPQRKFPISDLQYKLVKRGRGRPSHALKCPECDQAINSKLAMRLHFRTVHRRRGFSNATCDVCGDQFSSLKILK